MLKNPPFRIALRMFIYGIVFSTLTSGFIFVVLPFINDPDIYPIIFWLVFILPVSLFFGGLAGILSGLAMGIITNTFLPKHLTSSVIHAYRLFTGLVTACITSIVFIPLWLIALYLWALSSPMIFVVLLISIGIGVYASQRTVTKYLRDIDVRKMKVK